ncbi:MAG: hypothetical protein IPL46_03120 [Saprospiraceae bacterium]|nr:hypothetical protein [Saprospiraceae bacterium]
MYLYVAFINKYGISKMELDYPLSKVQLELLTLFSRKIEDHDILEIKRLIVKYLSEKVAKQANEIWEQKQWSDENMEDLLGKHLRTPYEVKRKTGH